MKARILGLVSALGFVATTSGASAQAISLGPVAVGDSQTYTTIAAAGTCTNGSTPMTCTYGGISVVHRNVLNAVVGQYCACFVGNTGPQGPAGSAGATGATGSPGASVVSASEPPGANCAQGGSSYTVSGTTRYVCNGAPGSQGIQGVPGATGATGPASTVPGPQGVQGIQGARGDVGPAGSQGIPGNGVIVRDVNGTEVTQYQVRNDRPYWFDSGAFWPMTFENGLDVNALNSTPDQFYYFDNTCNGQRYVPALFHSDVRWGYRGSINNSTLYLPGNATSTSGNQCWVFDINLGCKFSGCPGQYMRTATPVTGFVNDPPTVAVPMRLGLR